MNFGVGKSCLDCGWEVKCLNSFVHYEVRRRAGWARTDLLPICDDSSHETSILLCISVEVLRRFFACLILAIGLAHQRGEPAKVIARERGPNLIHAPVRPRFGWGSLRCGAGLRLSSRLMASRD